MSKRTHNVQTPGETPTTAPEGDQTAGQAADTQNAAETPATPTQTEPTAAPAKKPAEPTKPAKKPAERPDYARMHAADIDPDTLTAPVLSLDGWVIPTPKPATKA